ncbi:enoyl-CoA hydratase-related protein [Wenxinia saemankumensis]|uniref:2-(1,2-epoxy-1,2-dihydrophenyl)acetyl-CoA isomerase n=1 Tax=Wenxinia saemankumensis TaxID=1447782 RepID=A0A1M6D389_9RHOB|nr:enoyl-CoA hydratase-related protein [Wenxinia saemankumensis]SHI67717.1 2-(1,2-epoxy-1,2-dihydrophenyl)acetyl-CoA isomerase [Wenxinia saemankumensis]
MQYQTIAFDLTDGVAVLRLDRPEVMNALNTQMRAEILHAVRNLPGAARVLVLTGTGRAFCSGQDLGDGVNAARMDLERVLRDEYAPMIRALQDAPVPVIAAVNGAAAGAGANLALVADVILASDEAFFQQAFTRIGLIPDAGGTWFLPRMVGSQRAMGAVLFADRIPARQAAEWGMVYEVTPHMDFEAHWRARAAQLATGPTEAFRLAREALRASSGADLETQLAHEARLQGRAGQTRDFKEGIVAFLEKRPAVFEGR